ncbi:MAG: serine/threonine protein kinase [Candidatus Obscuribacterales bacterium]|nr:serine/threonine protein kinase [Candidatus Obscuribacterales bacterium]
MQNPSQPVDKIATPKSGLRVVTADPWLIWIGGVGIVMCIIGFGTVPILPFALCVAYSLAVLFLGVFGIERKLPKFTQNSLGYDCNPKVAVTDQNKLAYLIDGQGTYEVTEHRILVPAAKESIEFQWLFLPAEGNSPPVLVKNLSIPGKALAIAQILKARSDLQISAPTQRERLAHLFLASIYAYNNWLSTIILLMWVPQLIMAMVAFSFWTRGNTANAIGTLIGAPLISLYFVPFILTHVWSVKHKTVFFFVNLLLMPAGALLANRLNLDSQLSYVPLFTMWSALVATIYLAHKMPFKVRSIQGADNNENLFLPWNPILRTWGHPLIEQSNYTELRGLLKVGDVLDDRYRIMECIGSGGTGSVYKAQDEELNRILAVKVLHAEQVADPEDRKRFKREAKLLSELLHENVAKLYRFGIAKNQLPFLIMEYVEGNALDRIIARENCFLPGRAANLLLQICDGLQSAHDKGIVHRDLKPGNIMVGTTTDHQEQIKIIDFGLASGPEHLQSQKLTASGLLIGTAAYMSPEQCRGEKADPRSDIYAFGCIAYEMLTSQPPFTCENPIGLMAKHIGQLPSPVDAFRRDIPRGLKSVIEKAMSKSPTDRYQTVREMRDDLRAISFEEIDAPPIHYPTHRRRPTGVLIGAPASSKAWPDLVARVLFLGGTLGQFLPLLGLEQINAVTCVVIAVFTVYLAGVIHFRASTSKILVLGVPFILICLFEILLAGIFRFLAS